MRISTDDERFGFIVTHLTGRDMFRFQLIISGQVIGDSEPCILGSAMKQLGNLRTFDDERLAELSSDPAAVIFALRTDQFLHDASTLSLAESLDEWMVNGFIYDGRVVMLAQDYRDEAAPGVLLTSLVDTVEYDSIFHAVHGYWSETKSAVR
jgi:hypothetical protein